MKYARNMWYNAAWCAYVEADKPFAIRVLDEPIVLWRADGKIVAHEDRCCHRFAPMSLGRCEGSALRCMYHGFLFDADGKCIEIPGQDMVPEKARIKKYPTKEKNGAVWIWMGDPEKADESLIPETISPDSDEWIFTASHLDFEAEAELLNQNLLDFSHLPYVHEVSFRLGESHSMSLPRWDTMERGLQYTHWDRDVEGIGADHVSTPGRFDNLTSYDIWLPGVMVLRAGAFPVGTADECNGGRPDFSKGLFGLAASTQTVTPTSKGKARYHFGVGGHRDKGGVELKEAHFAKAEEAFAEDLRMIEGQQKVIDELGDDHPVLSVHDRANTQFLGMLRQTMDAYGE